MAKGREFKKKGSQEDSDDDFLEGEPTPPKWFEELPEEPAEFVPVDEAKLVQLKDEAKRLHDAESLAFSTKNIKLNRSSNYQWIQTVLSKGTSSDKIAAYTILIQDNPVFNLKWIQNIVGMVKVGKKNDCLKVIQTLSQLFLEDLLIPDRKLKAFHQRPLSLLENSADSKISRKRLLILWYFEDQLKETYTLFVKALAAAAHDTVDATKEKAIHAMYLLLAGNPEQEQNLLTNIINKLGDPSKKVASKTIYCLNQLLYKHPNMKHVVLMEIEKLLFRANVSHKAQYYSICFLSQYLLTHDDQEVAKHLITVYFAFFKACVKKDEIDSRMMSALLMGVNRAYPYAKLELNQVNEHIDTLYKVVHQANFNVGLHALNLLFQVCDLGNSVNERFYSALYKKLIDPGVNNSGHQAIFLNLIFKALRKDTSVPRVNVFIKRLLHVALNVSVPMSCAILYTISQICRFKKHHLILSHEAVCLKTETDQIEQQLDNQNVNDTSVVQQGEDNSLIVNTLISAPNSKATVKNNSKKGQIDDDVKIVLKRNDYDPYLRNPLYAGGQFCVHTELALLQDHFHPTVALFSKNLANGQKIFYTGDPLKDFVLMQFLDRFVFKNPKKVEKNEEGEKPTKGYHFKFGQRKAYMPTGLRALPITSKDYLKEAKHKIPADELFMYTFLQNKMKQRPKKEADDDAESDADSVGSDEFNELLDKMAGKKKNENDDEEDLGVDFMKEVGSSLKQTKKKKSKDEEEESDSDMDNLEDDDAFDDDFDGDSFSEGEGEEEDINESDINFDSDEEEEKVLKKNNKKKGKRTADGDDLSSAFASAEEFAMMLENTGSSKLKAGMSTSISNTDNADEKQMVWEDRRNKWISGYSQALGKKKSLNKTSRKFGQKRQQTTKKMGKPTKKRKH